MEVWSIKAADFTLNYRVVQDESGEAVAIPAHLLQSDNSPTSLEVGFFKRAWCIERNGLSLQSARHPSLPSPQPRTTHHIHPPASVC
jgi:hypothetical protein